MNKIKVITSHAQLKDAIEKVINYNWEEEEEDYKHSTRENGPQPHHIFLVLQQLSRYVQ